ncbi:Uncharacterised protein [Mycolicibacterium vanbaalenii]|uniref:Uncharacterized protein n=1 Tax=Mycolicibacterium vanbaalenii TaxID=110539 RepID=A0A5S9R4F9_MYCVN|nr:hypothetical protein [Mycolicibacterium vanbaalenii]CAA0128370.1 Uncharacterised protein [Mycolicibacterium vanbaalenii]
MDLLSNLLVVAVALTVAASVWVWLLRRRGAFRSALAHRGWQRTRRGDTTTIVPATGDWTVTMSRSFAAQMSPPSSHVVTSVWSAPTPATHEAALVAGPAPDPQLGDLAAELLGSATPAMTRLLGIDRVSDGRPLRAVPSADRRLLVFATDGYGPVAALTGVADAVTAWCAVHRAEREQPVLTIDDTGVRVRVRADVLRSVEHLDAFVDLGVRCRDAIGRTGT